MKNREERLANIRRLRVHEDEVKVTLRGPLLERIEELAAERCDGTFTGPDAMLERCVRELLSVAIEALDREEDPIDLLPPKIRPGGGFGENLPHRARARGK